MEDYLVRVRGMTKLDRLELEGQEGVTFEEVPLANRSMGEPATFLMIAGIAALHTVAVYLLRKWERRSFEEVVEIVHPDGTIERRTIRWQAYSSEAPEAEIMKQLRPYVPS